MLLRSSALKVPAGDTDTGHNRLVFSKTVIMEGRRGWHAFLTHPCLTD